MLKANCRIKLDEYTEIPKAGVTPAEIVVLDSIHGKKAGGQVASNVVIVSDEPSSTFEEINRLSGIYGRDVITKLFPGAVPQIPQTFQEVGIKDVSVASAPEPVEPAEDETEDEPEDQEPEPVPVRQRAPRAQRVPRAQRAQHEQPTEPTE